MIEHQKEQLIHLSKEQLIYLIEKLNDSQFMIGETCVDESKRHINSDEAVNKIRGYLYYIPNTYNLTNFKAHIDMEMGKITVSEYRKIIGLDD